MSGEHLHGPFGERHRCVVLAKEVLDEEWDVLGVFSQRGQTDLEVSEPVQEILAEPPLGEQLIGIAVGCGEDAHGYPLLPSGAYGPDLTVVEKAEEFCLQSGGKSLDLIEEQNGAVGKFEEADVVSGGAGEGPLAMAEELALEQVPTRPHSCA